MRSHSAGGYAKYCVLAHWDGRIRSAHNDYRQPDYCLDSTLCASLPASLPSRLLVPLRFLLTPDPGNGVQPHAWECYDGAWQQNWVYHANGAVELAGRGLCLDVTDGDTTKKVQLWECTGGPNQQWDI